MRAEVRLAQTLVGKLTLEPDAVGPEDTRPLLEAGVDRASVEDVIAICAAFNTINRIADALEFAIPSDVQLRRAAPFIYRRGYVMRGAS